MVSAASYAGTCPDLSGQFRCSVMGLITLNIPVSQTQDKGVTVYMLDGAPVIADGEMHHAETLPKIMANYVQDVNYKATCEDTAVRFDGDGVSKNTGERAKVNGVLTKTAANALQIQMSLITDRGTRNVTANCRK